MKISKIAIITIIATAAIMLTGCQEQTKQQLAGCQQENTKLQTQIETQQQALSKSDTALQNSVLMITEALIENEQLRRENAKLSKALESQSKPQSAKPAQTTEQKANIQKGLQELFELQKKSAEKMKNESQKN